MNITKLIICSMLFTAALQARSQDSIDKIKYEKYFEFYTNEELKQKIFSSEKQYKIIYIFDINCSSFDIFPCVTNILNTKDNVDFFPISGQDVSDDEETIRFLDSMNNKHVIYRLERPKRKKFPIQIINMFKYVNKFLKYLDLNINYKDLSIGGYIILDKTNNVIFCTDNLYKRYANPMEVYYKTLKEL